MVSSQRVSLCQDIVPEDDTDSRRIPAIGKNPPYIATFAIFVILTILSALANKFGGLLVSRFLLGFFGKIFPLDHLTDVAHHHFRIPLSRNSRCINSGHGNLKCEVLWRGMIELRKISFP